LGEVGLTGEVRAIGQIETRVAEVKKMGFTRCLVPDGNMKRIRNLDGIELTGIKTVSEAVEMLFG
jgi:DNA repair protein RadA/Sms